MGFWSDYARTFPQRFAYRQLAGALLFLCLIAWVLWRGNNPVIAQKRLLAKVVDIETVSQAASSRSAPWTFTRLQVETETGKQVTAQIPQNWEAEHPDQTLPHVGDALWVKVETHKDGEISYQILLSERP